VEKGVGFADELEAEGCDIVVYMICHIFCKRTKWGVAGKKA
jgi:hypothetical protein